MGAPPRWAYFRNVRIPRWFPGEPFAAGHGAADRPSISPWILPELDRAGQAILGSLHRAASAAEANYQQAVEMNRKLSAQLRAAEDRIRDLENKAQYHEYKADRAEKWLYQISVEIEQKFFNGAPEPALRK